MRSSARIGVPFSRRQTRSEFSYDALAHGARVYCHAFGMGVFQGNALLSLRHRGALRSVAVTV